MPSSKGERFENGRRYRRDIKLSYPTYNVSNAEFRYSGNKRLTLLVRTVTLYNLASSVEACEYFKKIHVREQLNGGSTIAAPGTQTVNRDNWARRRNDPSRGEGNSAVEHGRIGISDDVRHATPLVGCFTAPRRNTKTVFQSKVTSRRRERP